MFYLHVRYVCVYIYIHMLFICHAQAQRAFLSCPRAPALEPTCKWFYNRTRGFLGNPRFPLKGSFKGDIDTGPSGWVAVKELNLSYHNMDTQ